MHFLSIFRIPLTTGKSFLTILAVGVTLVCVGCEVENRSSVSGEVLFHDKPIPKGLIRFSPSAETPGKGAAVEILEGAYSIPLESNLFAGEYAVSIYAEKETGRMLFSPDFIPVNEGGTGRREKYKEVTQYIPPQFNERTKLKAVLLPGGNTQDFKL